MTIIIVCLLQDNNWFAYCEKCAQRNVSDGKDGTEEDTHL